MFAMLAFGEVIARKSLNASGLSITLLTMTMPVASLTSIWWARIIVGRNQGRLLLRFGAVAFLILTTGVLLHSMLHLLLMYFLFYLMQSLFTPSENRILQQHIPSAKTGKLFGLAAAIRMGIAATFSVLAGMYMDRVENGYQHLYFFVAFVMLLAISQLASISTGHIAGAEPQPINKTLMLAPLKRVLDLLKRRKDFLRFEGAFMLYGIAFMMTLPVIPLYLVDDLGFSYSEIGLARGTIPQLVMILFIPFFGRIFDMTTPHRLATIIFFLLAFFPLLLLWAGMHEGTRRMLMIYAAFGLFGFAMSGVMVLWSLSSLRFAGDEDAGVYHSVHVAATGIRGMIAPLLGYFIMTTMGKVAALVAASCLWVISSGVTVLMRMWDYRTGYDMSLRAKSAINTDVK